MSATQPADSEKNQAWWVFFTPTASPRLVGEVAGKRQPIGCKSARAPYSSVRAAGGVSWHGVGTNGSRRTARAWRAAPRHALERHPASFGMHARRGAEPYSRLRDCQVEFGIVERADPNRRARARADARSQSAAREFEKPMPAPATISPIQPADAPNWHQRPPPRPGRAAGAVRPQDVPRSRASPVDPTFRTKADSASGSAPRGPRRSWRPGRTSSGPQNGLAQLAGARR